MLRRDFLRAGAGLGMLCCAWPGRAFAQSTVKPTWLSFGLNTPAGNTSRFPITAGLLQKRNGKRDPQLEITQNISQVLKTRGGDLVGFQDAVDIGAGPLLGAVLDYENVLGARLGNSSFIVLHLVGHGVLLNFDGSRGWKMLSSFPFPVTLLRESEGGDPQLEAQKYMIDAYTASQNSFAMSFVKAAQRTAPKWKDSDRGFNVRVMLSSLHPDVESKLASWKLTKNINDVWLGHLASAAACEGLGIPVVPYVENQSFGRFSYKFSDRLTAQNVRLPDENDIDLRLHVSLRNIGREVKFRNQLQRWEINRLVVIEVKALNDRNEEVISLRFGYQDDIPDALAREEDLVPARDAHFFDMAIYRGLVSFFSAIDRRDMAALVRLYVKPDNEQQKRIDNFRAVYQRAI